MSQLVIKSKNSKKLKILVNGAIENQLRLIRIGISKTEKLLKDFEAKFKLSSDQFIKLYEKGQFGDESDYMKWGGEIEIFQRLKNEMSELGEVEICELMNISEN
jgi:hypothetical protein